jgi:endonuclease YncB( thermonuclease family)
MKQLLIIILQLAVVCSVNAQNYYPKLDGTYIENYDGDTFKCSVLVVSEKRGVDFERKIMTIRLLNVDTYEINKKSQNYEENKKAFEAKKLVRELLEDGKIEIYPKYKDNYGRFVCEVYPSRSLESLKQILESKNLTTGKYEDLKIKKPRIIYYKK